MPPAWKLPPWKWTGLRAGAYWHPIRPSTVAGAKGETLPVKSAQVRGKEAGCVALADHPEEVASTTVSITPGEERKLRLPIVVV